jgi:putative oxidoreductase
MKIVVLIARVLLGLLFFVFGLNGFLHFIHQPPPSGDAGTFLGVLFTSHYVVPILLLQVAGGALLLIGRFVPLALVLLGPVVVNILIFHIVLAPAGLPLAGVTALLWLLVFVAYRRYFVSLFTSNAVPS